MLTLANAWVYTDGSLFDDIRLYDSINKEIMINTILDEYGDFYIITNDIEYYKRRITNLFERNYNKYKLIYSVLSSDYNPIENYDRMEDTVDNGTMHESTTGVHSINEKVNGISTTEEKTSAFDSSTYQPNSELTVTYEPETVTTDTYEPVKDGTNSNSRISRIHGNIGVTTTQQMIDSELKLRKTNIYKIIMEDFGYLVLKVY